MNYYINALKNYVGFRGRARRKEFWMFVLFNCIFSTVASLLDNVLGLYICQGVGIISVIYVLGVLLPSLAIAVRRMHDIGKTGWAILIALIPIVGGIILIVWACKPGVVGDNKYGPDPKAAM